MITTLALSAQFTGMEFAGPPANAGPYTNQNGPGELEVLVLSSGDNTLSFPDALLNVGGIWIEPTTTTNGITLTLKGSGGDTGLVMSSVNPSFIPVARPAVGSTVKINATAATNLPVRWL